MLDHNLEWRDVYDKATRAPENNYNGNAGGVDEVGFQMERQLDNENEEIDEGNATDEEDERNDEQLTECWLIPDDANTVDIMFQAMTECQALHPDSADSVSEESDFMDDDDESFDNGLGPAANSGRDDADDAQGGMRNLNLNDERFADADE